jgi:hypothetical protein
MRGESYYDVAQICLGGHIINGSFRTFPQHNQERCSNCGQETITTCQGCGCEIRGRYYVPGVIGGGGTENPPAFCHKCGKPYPWTESRVEAARDLAEQLDLDLPERTLLEKSIEEMVRDTPRAPAEAVRFKKIVESAKPWGLGAFKEILYGIAGEAVKRIVWPQ